RVYRMFLLLWAGIATNMDRPSHSATAYRVVLELPEDSDHRFWTQRSVRIADVVRGTAAAAREQVLRVIPKRFSHSNSEPPMSDHVTRIPVVQQDDRRQGSTSSSAVNLPSGGGPWRPRAFRQSRRR